MIANPANRWPMAVVDNIRLNKTDKKSVWDINTEVEYHESKA